MIGSASNKPGSAPPLERIVDRGGAAESRPTVDPAADSGALPPRPAPAAAQTTRSALPLPVVKTLVKQRYPKAPPRDLEGWHDNFSAKQAKLLRGRLKAGRLNVSHLFGYKHPALRDEIAARHEVLATRKAFSQLYPNLPARDYEAAVNQLRELVQIRDAAQATLSARQHGLGLAKLIQDNARVRLQEAQGAAQNPGAPPEAALRVQQEAKILADAVADEQASRAELAVAEQTLRDTAPLLAARMPPWVHNDAGSEALQRAVGSRVRLQAAEAGTNQALRLTWVSLGERTLTKLQHFTQGSYGKVSVALRTEDGSLRALKVLRQEPSKKNGSTQVSTLEQARAEVAAMRRYYDADVTLSHDPLTPKLTIEMPLAMGALHEVHARGDVCLVRSAGRQVFETLAAMHADGMLHFDIKPSNINVHGDGRIKLADFGRARSVMTPGEADEGSLDRVASNDAGLGTVEYSAPEQIEAQPDASRMAADVWSAGLSLAGVHVSLDAQPFDQQDVGNMAREHGAYAQWHATMVDREAERPTTRMLQDLGEGAAPWSKYFQQLHATDAQLCDFLLTRVLVPQASQRATAAEAHAFFAELQAAHDPAESALKTRLQARDDTPARRAQRLALELRAELQHRQAASPQ